MYQLSLHSYAGGDILMKNLNKKLKNRKKKIEKKNGHHHYHHQHYLSVFYDEDSLLLHGYPSGHIFVRKHI